MPRFVILEHDCPHLHWDLMLEMGNALRTWRLAAPPTPGVFVAAVPLGDHRLHYLDYEGPVSGGRGSVRRWDQGTYDDLKDGAFLEFHLAGSRVYGRCAIASRTDGTDQLSYTPDTV